MLVKGGPEALAITKNLLRELPGVEFAEGLRRMADLSAERFTSAEGQEGIAAFMEKRPPRWVPCRGSRTARASTATGCRRPARWSRAARSTCSPATGWPS